MTDAVVVEVPRRRGDRRRRVVWSRSSSSIVRERARRAVQNHGPGQGLHPGTCIAV